MEIMSFDILINVIFVAQNKDANYTQVNFYSAHTYRQINILKLFLKKATLDAER